MRLKNESRKETVIQKSRFIACATVAKSEEEAKAYIDYIRDEFRDATMYVPHTSSETTMPIKNLMIIMNLQAQQASLS